VPACCTAGSINSSSSSLAAQAVLKRPAIVFGLVVLAREVLVSMILQSSK